MSKLNDEVLWEVVDEHLKQFHPENRTAQRVPLLRSNVAPAIVTVVLPGGTIRAVCLDPHAASFFSSTPTPDPAALIDEARNVVLQAFYASRRFDHVLNTKTKVAAVLHSVIHNQIKPTTTVTHKPDYQALYEQGRLSYAVCRLSDYCWCLIASFLSATDCLALPQVGSVFFAERNEIVWKTLYQQCFGEFTPKELRLVNPWDDFEVDDETENKEGAQEEEAEEDAGEWKIQVIDHHRNLRRSIFPFLCAAKRSYTLRPSPEDFLQHIAPKGTVTVGNRRFLLTNVSPLHFVMIPTQKAEIFMEEIETCLGVVCLLTVAVVLPIQHPQAANVVTTPAMRRMVVAAAVRHAMRSAGGPTAAGWE